LGENFDSALRIIENENDRFEIINSLRLNIRRLLIFYFGVFFLPALLMTLIIALSFTRKVTYPIDELTEATKTVAEGDLSIRILPRRGDELALLIQSFNAMVKDLEKSRAALLNTEKINVWRDIAQRLAHEIKNPLTPIRLSAERVLRRWQNEPDRINEILENSMLAIIQETESLSTLLSDFRTLSRPTMEISDSHTALYDVVDEIIRSYKSSHPHIRFDIEHLGKGISLKIDKSKLHQILTNLIINGIDAMNGDGLIEIRSDLVKKEGGEFCRTSIKDTGKGISKQDVPFVFTPYFTTKETGTGLGLPIIERIIHDHKGSIWFDSDEGAGTTFYMDLPMEKEA
jgi:nitrogen fixation/metabolism regulation signal transduction histidine kinase